MTPTLLELDGADGARMTSTRVDLEDVLTLVLYYFMWLVLRLFFLIAIQAMSDRLRCQGGAVPPVRCVHVQPYPIKQDWHVWGTPSP